MPPTNVLTGGCTSSLSFIDWQTNLAASSSLLRSNHLVHSRLDGLNPPPSILAYDLLKLTRNLSWQMAGRRSIQAGSAVHHH